MALNDKLCVILLDISGSMTGASLDSAKQYINSLPYRKCEIYPFNDELLPKLDKIGMHCIQLQFARAHTLLCIKLYIIAQNIQYVHLGLNALDTSGGTEIINALRSMFNIIKNKDDNIRFILVTDAQDNCTNNEIDEMITLRDQVSNQIETKGFRLERALYLINLDSDLTMQIALEKIFGMQVTAIASDNVQMALEKSAKIATQTLELEKEANQLKSDLENTFAKQENCIEQINYTKQQV